MDTKNIVIIILICAIVALSTYFLTVNMLMNQNPQNQSVNTINNTTNNSSQSNNDQKKVLAYKSDGTPMYTQSEVDQYMLNKYGMVDYHIQGNGYINLDEPGYTDDGRRTYSDAGNYYYYDYSYGSGSSSSDGSSSGGSSSEGGGSAPT